MMRLRSFWCALLCLPLLACPSGEDPGPTDDSSGDSAVEDGSESDPVVDSATDLTNDPGPEDPAADPAIDPVVDPSADPGVDPVADPAVDPSADPGADPAVDPAVDLSADPDAAGDSGCDPGFEPSPEGCVDVNECTASPCSADATCANTEGGFTCTCNEGFEGDGTECAAAGCTTPEPFRFTKRNGRPGEDCITENVCLTRGDNGPVFNSAREAEADRNGCETVSPVGTEYAVGACLGNEGPFVTLRVVRACESMSTVAGARVCMHLLEDDLWYDMTWHSFTGGGEGGGFSYTRTLAGGDPCGVGAACSTDGGPVTCTCPEGTEGDPESFCR